jgi:hypothetical protein
MLDPECPEYGAAHNLWTKGKGHLFGAIAIEQASRAYAVEHGIGDAYQFVFSGQFSASLHMLVAFAAEILLKSAFILHGGDPADVRKPDIRHDLIKLLDAAEGRGFEAPDAQTRAILEYLREPHLKHQFRYGDMPEVPMPGLVHTIPALQLLSNKLQDMLEGTLPYGE